MTAGDTIALATTDHADAETMPTTTTTTAAAQPPHRRLTERRPRR